MEMKPNNLRKLLISGRDTQTMSLLSPFAIVFLFSIPSPLFSFGLNNEAYTITGPFELQVFLFLNCLCEPILDLWELATKISCSSSLAVPVPVPVPVPVRLAQDMFSKTKVHTFYSYLEENLNVNINARSISSLKVVWRKDPALDRAIEFDKRYKQCARVVKEVLNEPGQVIPLRYLEKRRERMRLKVKIETFLNQNPFLFDVYYDRIKPKTEPVRFLRVSDRLMQFLEEEKRIFRENEPLIVSKLCKLLMMSKNRVLSADKLLHVKREFGFPNDFLVDLVPRYPEYFRLTGFPGEGKSFLELVSWNPEFAKSVIEQRAVEESERIGIRVRPSFNVQLPPGFVLKKEMRDWVRDWMVLDYVSPYEDVSHLDQASREMEKRSVGVFHELLSLSLNKRIPVPILGKFCDEYRFSNAFSSTFTRHSGIFYLSLKGGIETAMLREAYVGDKLIDLDPLLQIKDKFIELLEEGWRLRAEQLRLKQEKIKKDMELMATRVSE